jgi:hypothetical protein
MQSQLLSRLSDAELLAAVAELATRERRATASLVAHLGEMLARQLHLAAGYPSLFIYCVKVLRLSGGGAYNRLEAAKAARRFPAVLGLLERGELSLATLRLVAPHLTPEDHGGLLAEASGKTKREVEKLLARRFPQPDVPTLIRKLPRQLAPAAAPMNVSLEVAVPQPRPVSRCEGGDAGLPVTSYVPSTAPAERECAAAAASALPTLASNRLPTPSLTRPLSADRYLLRFTARAETREKLQRAQDMLRHAVPDGDLGEIVDRALTALIAELEKRKFAATERPHPAAPVSLGSRTIPATVRRSVVARDQGGCAFVGSAGRCEARAFLEFHHVVPYARGGEATAENIQLRCRAHNGHEAELDYGRREYSSRDEK